MRAYDDFIVPMGGRYEDLLIGDVGDRESGEGGMGVGVCADGGEGVDQERETESPGQKPEVARTGCTAVKCPRHDSRDAEFMFNRDRGNGLPC